MKNCPKCSKTYDDSWSVCIDDRLPLEESSVATMPSNSDKACPFCKETIKSDAIKCRFCGENLRSNASEFNNSPRLIAHGIKEQKADEAVSSLISFVFTVLAIAVGYYFKNWYVFGGILFLGVVACSSFYWRK